jgi:type II secretory pathway pseudopilin PulG
VELAVVIAVFGIIISVTAYGFSTYTRTNRGLNAAADLRLVWMAQKAYIVKHLNDPTALRLGSLTIATLRAEGFLPSAPLPSESYGSIDASVMPPLHSMDGHDGDEAKTSRSTGDHLYDVGPE